MILFKYIHAVVLWFIVVLFVISIAFTFFDFNAQGTEQKIHLTPQHEVLKSQ